MGDVLRLRHCAECGKELPAAKKTGRPRKYCDDDCRYAAKARRELVAWHHDDELAAFPTDPLVHRTRTLQCIAELLDGRTPAAAEDQLVQVLIELQQITYTLRRLEPDLPRRLAGRAGGLAAELRTVLLAAFPTLDEETA